MKVELHLHTNRYSGCAVHSPPELMQALVQAGYEAVYITEHGTCWSDGELAQLHDQFGQIRIFPGVEITLMRPAILDVLVLGSNDPAYTGISDAGALLERARGEGHLTVLAHPYRWGGAEVLFVAGLLPDAMEGRTNNQDFAQAQQAAAAAADLGLPVVNAGDVHRLAHVNRFWIQTSRRLERADDIRRVVLTGQYDNCTQQE